MASVHSGKKSLNRPLAAAAHEAIERLESRQLFAATVLATIPSQFGTPGATATVVDLNDFVADPANESTVNMVTSTGTVQIQTFDQEVPINTTNFLRYVRRGLYDNAIFQRSVLTPVPFVLQGGGEYADGTSVPSLGQIQSEPNGPRHNVRGTLAFARVGPESGGGPDTATNQFFFNLGDNSANLDAQNGGFTVFGQVQGTGMDVIDQLAALPNATDRKILSADVVQDMTYTVTSSDPSQVTPSVNAQGILSLNFASATSQATITVTGTDLSNNTVQTTFAAAAGFPVSLGGSSGNKSITYTQTDGTVSTISLKGNGSANVILNGVSLTQSTRKGNVAITGQASVASLDITGTDAKTSLSIKTRGGTGITTLGGLTADGAVRSISGKAVRLTGALSVGGTAGAIVLGDVTNTSITLGGSGTDKGATLSLGNITDTSITSAEPIRSLKVASAVNSDGTADNISAAGITSLASSGDFGASINLSGENNLRSMKVGGNLTGNITAHQIGSLSVKGDITSIQITASHGAAEVVTAGGNPDSKANQAIQSIKVHGAIAGSTVRSGGSFGSISAGDVTSSLIVSGAPAISQIPTQVSDIPEPGSILSFKSKSFASTFVIARNLGKVSLGTVSINNSGSQFGAYADTIVAVSGRTNGTPAQKINVKRPADQTGVDTQLTGVTLGDFVVKAL